MSLGLTFRQLHLSRLCSLFGFWFQKSCSNGAFILGVKLGKRKTTNNYSNHACLIPDYRQTCRFLVQINKVVHIMCSLLLHIWPLTPLLAQASHICGSLIKLNVSPRLNTQTRNTLWFSGFPVNTGPILSGKGRIFYIYADGQMK